MTAAAMAVRPISAPAVDARPLGKLRQRVIQIPDEVLLDVLAGRVQITNLPPGAKLLSSWFDSLYDGFTEVQRLFCVRIEHPDLPAFPEGGRIPHVAALLRRPMTGHR